VGVAMEVAIADVLARSDLCGPCVRDSWCEPHKSPPWSPLRAGILASSCERGTCQASFRSVRILREKRRSPRALFRPTTLSYCYSKPESVILFVLRLWRRPVCAVDRGMNPSPF
jgi:hypothetical protein